MLLWNSNLEEESNNTHEGNNHCFQGKTRPKAQSRAHTMITRLTKYLENSFHVLVRCKTDLIKIMLIRRS